MSKFYVFALSQVFHENPIRRSSKDERREYLRTLMEYIKKARWRNKWVRAEQELYRDMIYSDERTDASIRPEEKFWFMLADIAAITGYRTKMMDSVGGRKILFLLRQRNAGHKADCFESFVKAVWERDKRAWKKIEGLDCSENLKHYLAMIKKNQEFSSEEPVRIMVTAMMSAGKSTFINAIAGRKLCWSKNAACTSKIHSIVGKPYDDTYVYEDDHVLRLNASQEVLFDDDLRNKESNIAVSAYFYSTLAGKRIEIYDSPGVNSSLNVDHKDITENIIEKHRFDLYVYMMNATQLMTEDEAVHLDFIKANIKNRKIIFVINKVDELDAENEDLKSIIKEVRTFLINRGFKEPHIYAVAAEAALLGRCMAGEELNRRDRRKLEFLLHDLVELNGRENIIDCQAENLNIFKALVEESGILPIEKEIANVCKER